MNDSLPHPQLSRRRSSSAVRQSGFQIRANNLVKRLGCLTSKFNANARSKNSSVEVKECPQAYAYCETRSINLMRTKPFMSSPMLAINFQSQSLSRSSADDSSQSHSNSHGNESDGVQATRTPKSAGAVSQGLAVTAFVAEATIRPPASGNRCVAKPAIQLPNGTYREERRSSQVGAGVENCVTSQADTSSAMQSRLAAVQPNVESTRQSNNYDSSVPPLSSKRPAVPRLSTLPPLNLNFKGVSQDQRMSRLSPSVIVRPPPFPILELPALPTPIAETSSSQSRARPAARLNSMPMLPMEGQDERENDTDHENYGLEEEEEGDEGDEEEVSGANAASDDEDEDASRTTASSALSSTRNGLLARTRKLSPRLPTSSLSSLIGGIGAGPSSAGSSHSGLTPATAESANRMQRDEAATPKAADGNGSAKRDYFLFYFTGSAEDRTKGRDLGENFNPRASAIHSPRTPTAHDYSSQTPTQPTMIYMPPPSPRPEAGPSISDSRTVTNNLGSTKFSNAAGIPHLPLPSAAGSPKRPGIYHHASKSMVELFTTAATPISSSIVTRPAGADIKGKGKEKDMDADLQMSNSNFYPSGKVESASSERDMGTLLGDVTSTSTKAPAGVASPISVAVSESAPSLRRQHSLPTFNGSGPPPPYLTFLLPDLHHPNNASRFMPTPREDEGAERLPPYSNDIHLAAILPRKLEFSAPGMPARDRKWRRVHCILEGTAFRVYDAPPRVTGVSAIGGWWERKVGVGDVSIGQPGGIVGTNNTNIVLGRKEPKRRMKWEEELQAEDEQNANVNGEPVSRVEAGTTTLEVNLDATPPHKPKRHIAANFLHPSRSRISLSSSRSRPSSPSSPRSSSHVPRSSTDTSTSSQSAFSAPTSARPSADFSNSATTSASGASPASSASLSAMSTTDSNASAYPSASCNSPFRRLVRSDSAQSQPHSQSHSSRSHARSQSQPLIQVRDLSRSSLSTLPEPDPKDLLRVYSLQRAESGLASDYTKRKNVVRVRMEGEQFLLQCTDVAGVVEWIEGLQAAANIALDLDERPMPKGPIFPRRRRRRRVQRTASTTDQPTEAATTS